MTTAPVSARGIRIGPEGRPERTLGWDVLGWTAAYLLQPDGPDAGSKWDFTDEQARFVLWWYAIDEQGRFIYRSGVLRRMKGWGKDPVGAALCAVEFVGPCRFGGWKANGEPIVIPHSAAWVQTAAVNREQTRNTMTLFPSMFSDRAIEEYRIDLGKEIIYAHRGRSRIESVTSSPRALEGGRASFVLRNETHHWIAANEGLAMSDVIARNAAKSRDASSRTLAITNAHNPGEDSDAERDWKAWEQIRDAGIDAGFLYDSLEATAPADATLDDSEQLRQWLLEARGDSHWLDIDRLIAEIHHPRTTATTARRFYLNQVTAEQDAWLTVDAWKAIEREFVVPDGDLITIGFDGSRVRDTTALVGTHIETGYQWVIGVWERPEIAAHDWEVPREEVTMALEEAFRRWNVWRAFADPPEWDDAISRWQGRWGERIFAWRTNSIPKMGAACREYEIAVKTGDVSHGYDPVFARHVSNAVKRVTNFTDLEGNALYYISKDGPNSPRKIDIAVAAIISHEARREAIAAGVLSMKPKGHGIYLPGDEVLN